ncbi:MAG: NDP-sugar synthase [Myxococcales bacterium]|nr:NDP-sugar synthase [Myxococcales bacterium]
MKAIVLCAGLGTRLRPLTELWPKPAVPLLGQPLLRYALAGLRRAGVTAVGINTHWLPEVMERVARAECERMGLSLTTVREPEIRGTGGGIRGLAAMLADGPAPVVNGDVLLAAELGPILEAHRRSAAAATMVLLPMPAGQGYAPVEIDGGGAVRRIAGRGPGGDRLSSWHFSGVHVLSPQVLEHMEQGPEDINRDVYPRLIAAGATVRGHLLESRSAYWSDLGTLERYAAAHRDLLFGRVPGGTFLGSWPLDPAHRGEGNFWAHPSAVLSGARVAGPAFFAEGCVLEDDVRIGAGVSVGRFSRVGRGAALNRVAVLDGASVTPQAQLEDAVVLPGGRVVPA